MDFESISSATRTRCHVDLGTYDCPCGSFFEATACPLVARATVASMFVLSELVAADGISPLWGSNPRPYAYEAHALPAELRRPCCRVPICTRCMNNICASGDKHIFLTDNAARVLLARQQKPGDQYGNKLPAYSCLLLLRVPCCCQRWQDATRPRGVTVSTLDSESSDRGSNPREALMLIRAHSHRFRKEGGG